MSMFDRKRTYDGTLPKTPVLSLDASKRSTRKLRSEFLMFMEHTPHEMLLQLIELLDRTDVISLASTSKPIRRRLLPYIFDRVKCSWDDLLIEWKSSCGVCAPISNPELIETLRLTSSCSKNEWAFPFHVLFDRDSLMLNLKSITLPSSGSTNFFKYCDVAPGLLKLQINADRSDSAFCLEHVRNFPYLKELILSSFHIEEHDDGASDICPKLKTLRLENCTWNYPFNLENLGKNNISSLHLEYSSSFIISERFKHFLSCPSFTNLKELSIVNNENNLRLTISVQIMTLIQAMPTLKILKLKGNIYNEALIRASESTASNHTNVVAVRDVKVLYSSFLRDIR